MSNIELNEQNYHQTSTERANINWLIVVGHICQNFFNQISQNKNENKSSW